MQVSTFLLFVLPMVLITVLYVRPDRRRTASVHNRFRSHDAVLTLDVEQQWRRQRRRQERFVTDAPTARDVARGDRFARRPVPEVRIQDAQ